MFNSLDIHLNLIQTHLKIPVFGQILRYLFIHFPPDRLQKLPDGDLDFLQRLGHRFPLRNAPRQGGAFDRYPIIRLVQNHLEFHNIPPLSPNPGIIRPRAGPQPTPAPNTPA